MIVVLSAALPVHAERGVHATDVTKGLGDSLSRTTEALPQEAILDGDRKRGKLVAVTSFFSLVVVVQNNNICLNLV